MRTSYVRGNEGHVFFIAFIFLLHDNRLYVYGASCSSFLFQPAVISQSTDTGDSISADPDSILDIKKRLERIKNNSRN